MEVIHSLLCILMLFSGFFVAFSRNPVESVLFLILAFCNAAAILFIFNSDFLGLLFVIIYVGAIAVLFLFVVMMLNVKGGEMETRLLSGFQIPNVVFALLAYVLCIMIYFFFDKILQQPFIMVGDFETSMYLDFDSFNNIEVMGQSLYNNYLICFILAGLILLISLIGSIVLTLRYSSRQKNQLISRQLSRTDNFLSFFR